MGLDKLVVGSLQTNCYLVWDEETKKSVIVDPGDDSQFIIQRILDLDLQPQLIIATHGHFDHVLGATELKLCLKIPLFLHQNDLFLFKRAQKTSQYFTKVDGDPTLSVDSYTKAGQKISLGTTNFKIIETPGHTPGSISIVGEKAVFSGDVIFLDGYGRTDYSYASEKDLEKSVKKILKLPYETIIYPGHGLEVTVGEARENLSF